MGVSGIGAAGIGLGGAAGIGGAGAVGAAGAGGSAASTSAQSLDGTFLQGTTPAGPEDVNAAETGYDAEFLKQLAFTLIILALLEKGDDEKCGGGGAAAVLGFLAGLSMADALGQASSSGTTGLNAAGSAAGGGLNLLA